MTRDTRIPETGKTDPREPAQPRKGLSLSAKLLLLTVAFVMLAEILVFVPSVANFRVNWLEERLAAAQIAVLAAEVIPADHQLPAKFRDELLRNAQVSAVALKRGEARQLILKGETIGEIAGHYDLRNASWFTLVHDALAVYTAPKGQRIRVGAEPIFGGGDFIEIVAEQDPLKAAMIRFGLNILWLSIAISIITATLVYLAINTLLVRPITRLTRDMVRFGEEPEDPARLIEPSDRRDEIGTAERQLAHMQRELQGTLQHKSRLAALGLAVSKLNHDLRNMLASAQMLSDRLGAVRDPTVQRFAPKLIASLDRAIKLCTETLKYGRTQEPAPERERFALAPLVQEVGEGLGLPREGGAGWRVDMAPGLEIDADRDQLYRVLSNLVRNACQALETLSSGDAAAEVTVRARRRGAVVAIEVSDTGPGVPERAREHLFQAFQGAARKGGTGLGLAISAELVRAHGGEIALLDTERGACFRVSIPDRVVDLQARRRQA